MKIYTVDGRCNICGERIRKKRIELGLSQTQLAAKIQIAGLPLEQMAISRIETGKRVVADFELPIIAGVLEITVYDLLGI